MRTVIADSPPAPVPLQELKSLLRIITSEEDALLSGFMRAAAEMCEAFTGRALIERAVEETLPASGAWTRLSAAPVRSIEGVAAFAEGVAVPLATEDYSLDIDASRDGWVRVSSLDEHKRVQVSYHAGMAVNWNGVPEALRQGILRLAAHLYANREEAADPPAAVTALWRPWRRLRLH